jgi:hypothetical protein
MSSITTNTETLEDLPPGEVSAGVLRLQSADSLEREISGVEINDKEKETGVGGILLR